jgi:hypothetical protein
MDISQNHVSYDESQHTLTVTTYYNERTFLTLCFEKILFHKRPPIPGRTNGCRDSYYNFLKIVLFILLGCESLRFFINLANGQFAPRYLLIVIFLIFLFFWGGEILIGLATLLLSPIFISPLVKNTQPGQIVRTIRNAFALHPTYEQTVTITPDRISPDMIYLSPDNATPIAHPDSFTHFQVKKDDIFLITYYPHFSNNKVKLYVPILRQSYHFTKSMYTPHDWDVLLSSFNALGYSNS